MVTASTPNNTYRQGLTETVVITTPASTMINVGDVIWNNAGVAAVASSFTWTSNLATTQTNFAPDFLGISLDSKLASDASTKPILVLTRGMFTYPCAALSQAQNIGVYVAPDKDTGNNLLDQQMVVVASGAYAIGTLCRNAASGATSLEVYLQSTQIYGQAF